MDNNDAKGITFKSWSFIGGILTSLIATWIIVKYPSFSDLPFQWIIPSLILILSIYLLKTLKRTRRLNEHVRMVLAIITGLLVLGTFLVLRPTKADSTLEQLKTICQDKVIWGGEEPACYDQSFKYMEENQEQYVAGGWGDWAQEETKWVSLKSLAMGGFTVAGGSVGSVGAVNQAATAGANEQILLIRRLDTEELKTVGKTKVPRSTFNVSDLESAPLSTDGDAKEYVHCNIPLRPMAGFEVGDLVFFRGAMLASGAGPSYTNKGIENVPVSYVRCSGVERLTPLK